MITTLLALLLKAGATVMMGLLLAIGFAMGNGLVNMVTA